MIHDALLSTDALLQATGFDRPGDLTRVLDQQGIKWFPGKGGRPWTTMALINKAGGLYPADADAANSTYSPDDV
ncbi:hypothetical protein [Rhodanobacter lindaniclasticus]